MSAKSHPPLCHSGMSQLTASVDIAYRIYAGHRGPETVIGHYALRSRIHSRLGKAARDIPGLRPTAISTASASTLLDAPLLS